MTSGLGQHYWKEILLSVMERRWKNHVVEVGWRAGGVCSGILEVLGKIRIIALLANYEILELGTVGGVLDEHKYLEYISI